MTGHLILLVAPPSTKKGTVAKLLFKGNKDIEYYDEWLCTVTINYVKEKLKNGKSICFTTTPAWIDAIFSGEEFKELKKEFNIVRLDLTNINIRAFPKA